MARSPLTLAALATSAVADLHVVGTVAFGTFGSGSFDSAVLTDRDGMQWIVRAPRTQSAEREQSADLVALRALTTGVRERLPFDVPVFAGQAPLGRTRAMVYSFLGGSQVTLSAVDVALATSMGEAIAAIHSLPTSLVTDAGLPGHSSVESHSAALALIDRAAATRLVPASLLQRWERAGDDPGLWQFDPVVTNGDLSASSFLTYAGDVTGVLGWHGLRIGDPARDLFWAVGAKRGGTADAVFDAYMTRRGSVDRRLRQRATLLSELEVAKWLLHGTERKKQEIIDDAVVMMSKLVDDVLVDATDRIDANTAPILGIDEVEDLLDRAERVS